MKKLKLQKLEVESFNTNNSLKENGTINGHGGFTVNPFYCSDVICPGAKENDIDTNSPNCGATATEDPYCGVTAPNALTCYASCFLGTCRTVDNCCG